MDWSEAEALYALQSIRKDADHPVGGRIAFERKADTAGAAHQSKYFFIGGIRKAASMHWPIGIGRPDSFGMRYHPGKSSVWLKRLWNVRKSHLASWPGTLPIPVDIIYLNQVHTEY